MVATALPPLSHPAILSVRGAGRCFRLAKDYKRCVEAYKQASNAHKQYKAMYHAGKALENAGDAMKDAKAAKDALLLWQQASDLFRRDGKHEAAASVLEKAGKLAESGADWPAAADYYLQVVDVRETEGQMRTLKKTLTKAIQMCIKANQLPKALELIGPGRRRAQAGPARALSYSLSVPSPHSQSRNAGW